MVLTSPTTWRAAWQQLRSEPAPAALVIAGLALGLALALVTAGYLHDTLWPDAELPQADRAVTFEWQVRTPDGGLTDWMAETPATPLHDALRDAGAPLALTARVLNTSLPARAVDARGTLHHAQLNIAIADPDVQALFALQPLAGDLHATLASPDAIALTDSTATRLFGTAQGVVGRTLTASVSLAADGPPQPPVLLTLTVGAVLPAPLANATLQFDALAGVAAPAAQAFIARESAWTFSSGRLFARLQPGASAEQLTTLAQRLQDQQPLPPGLPASFLKGGGKFAYLRALPLADVGLHGAGSPHRRQQLGSLTVATGAVLVLAVINFVNLWSVRTLRRQREIGLRKSLGASGAQLAVQFFVEALVVAGAAGVAGLLLAWWTLPAVSALLQHGFDAPVVSPASAALVALLCVVVAACSALPLTGIALRVRPAASLAGRSHSEGRASRWLRRAMTTLQFGTATVFTALAVTVLWQAHHAAGLDRGFAIDGRLATDLPPETQPAQTRALLARIATWPEVSAAAVADDVPGREFADWWIEYRGPRGAPVNLHRAGNFTPGFLGVYGMHVRAGHLSADHAAEVAQRGVVLDVRATRALGFASPEAAVGQQLTPSSTELPPVTVVAVIDDIRIEGTRSPPRPHLLQPLLERGGGALSVATRDPAATLPKLTALLAETFHDAAQPVLPVSQQLARAVDGDARFGHLIGITGGLALALAAVGLYALASYTLRRREREIVLRKLHGAGAGAVVGLLAREFGAVIAAACVVALPLAAWLSQRHLAEFVERAPVGPLSLWPLLAALALLVLVTALAAARHLRTALSLRPLQALRG